MTYCILGILTQDLEISIVIFYNLFFCIMERGKNQREYYVVVTNPSASTPPIENTNTPLDGQRIEQVFPLTPTALPKQMQDQLREQETQIDTIESTPRAHLDKIADNELLHDTTPFHRAVAQLVPLLRATGGRISLTEALEATGLSPNELESTLSMNGLGYFFTDGEELVSQPYFPSDNGQ